jgi:hypothetical protein
MDNPTGALLRPMIIDILKTLTIEGERRFYTVNELTSVLKLGKSAVYNLLARGRLRGKQMDGRVVVTVAELDRFVSTLPDFAITEEARQARVIRSGRTAKDSDA